MTNIRVCEEEGKNNDIRVCEEKEHSDIVICDEKEELDCDTAPNPAITGSDGGTSGITVGAVYTGYSGTKPYSWEFDEGTLTVTGADNETATVATISSCASSGDVRWGTITITDACSKSIEKDIRLTGGEWCCTDPKIPDTCPGSITVNCNQDTFDNSRPPDTSEYSCYVIGGTPCGISNRKTIIGGFRYTENIFCYKAGSCGTTPIDGSNPCITTGCNEGAQCDRSCVVARWSQEWVCQ
jgi:hypothetical protein